MTDEYLPKTHQKTVLLSRSSVVPKSRTSLYNVSSSVSRLSGSGFFDPSVYSKMSNAGISDFRGNREKEKREMQGLNERLASYIEKVRFLEAQNKRLEAENEALRSRKQEDWKPIRDMYEGELNQCRELLKQMSTEKGVNEGRLAGMQDEIRSLKELINTYETQSKDYIKKIDQLNNQIGDYEGETATLRLRIASLEDEVGKYRDLLARLKEDNARLRADLDAETCAHIEHEVDAQAKAEEIEFLRDLLDKVQVQELPPVTVNGKDLEAFYKGEIARCVRDIQQEYDQQLSAMTMDIEAKYAAQMNQLRSGNARENFELAHSKEEVKRLKDELGKLKATIAELNAELSKTRSERDSYMAQLSELQLELDRERTENARRLDELNMQIEALMASLRELMDCKMSLELEISCYKKLLEGEENRTGLRQLVEQTIGTRGSGAASLADMIQQSS